MMIRTRLAVVAATAALAVGLGACTAAPVAAPPPPPAPTATWQDQMIAAVNAQRAGADLGPVSRCGTLELAAQSHSQDQAAHNTMSHIGSDGSRFDARANRAGYNGWSGLAENVAYGQPDTAAVMVAWMNSAGHRANILGSYTHIGVGLARSGNGTPYWTQEFGRDGRC